MIKQWIMLLFDKIKYIFIDTTKNNILYNTQRNILHERPNNKLIGLSGNARDLKDFIEHKISSISSVSDVNYRIKVDNAFKDEFNLYLERNNCKALSISTITRIVNELKDRRVLLPISKGYYLYNFVDYCHVGNREQYANDIKFFEIKKLLNKVDNN